MEKLIEYLPFLIPIAILELGLLITALVHIVRRQKTKNLNFVAWLLIIIIISLFGPVLYFLFGRVEDED